MDEKKKVATLSKKERLGYVALGVAVDYFIFKPVRVLAPVTIFAIGFGFGLCYDRIIVARILTLFAG